METPKFAVGDRVKWESISREQGVGTVTFVSDPLPGVMFSYVVTPDNTHGALGFVEFQLTKEVRDEPKFDSFDH
jgi:hypothetical protein